MAPLTHHEILRLIAPFTARGLHADLSSSKREERRLAFKPVVHPGGAGRACIIERLELHHSATGCFHLTRTLAAPDAPEAVFSVTATSTEDAMRRIEAVAPQTQFSFAPGYTVARSLHLSDGQARVPVLTRAVAAVGCLSLTLIAPTVARMPADLRLEAPAADVSDLPIDLLAVLGGAWAPIYPREREWRGTVRVGRREPSRSADCAARIETAARHLASVLAAPPACFHARFTLQRWLVAARLAMPLIVAIVLFAGALMLPIMELPRESVVWMLIFNSPPLLMLLVFSMREIPRIGIPPLPRTARAQTWTCASVPPAAPAAPPRIDAASAVTRSASR